MLSVVSSARSKLAIGAVFVSAALSLTGCGKSWDGRYEATSFRPGEMILEVAGSTAVSSRFKYGRLDYQLEFSVEQKSDKVIFRRKSSDNATYVFAKAADDQGLKCISDSCDSVISLLSKEWVRVNK